MKRKWSIAAAAFTLCLAWGATAYAQPAQMPDGTWFDAAYYAQANPDVTAALGTDAGILYQHYQLCGKAEGRAAVAPGTGTTDPAASSADFDAAYYARTYPDVVAALGTNADVLYQHYVQYGKAEGRYGKDPSVQASGGGTAESSYARQVLDLVNRERAAAGLSALSWSDKLAEAADIRAKEMVSLCAHTRPNGTNCFTVLGECGISYRTAGENIAWGQRTPEQVVTDWMNSPGHRANILNSKFGKLGVGYRKESNGYTYWTQLFTN